MKTCSPTDRVRIPADELDAKTKADVFPVLSHAFSVVTAANLDHRKEINFIIGNGTSFLRIHESSI